MQINLDTLKGMKLDVRSLLLGSAAGVLAGGGASYLVLRHTMRSNFDSRLNAEVAAVKSHYNERLKAQLSDAVSLLPEVGHPFVGQPGRGMDSDQEGGGEAALGDHAEMQVDSLRITDPYEGIDGDEDGGDLDSDDDEEDGSDEPDDPEPGHPLVRNLRKPYIISKAEFGETPPGWQQLTLTYYWGDMTLVDDKEQPVERGNVAKTIGMITKGDFGKISGDPNIVYVRNQDLELDFEVVWDPRSYADAVLHYGQPNRGS